MRSIALLIGNAEYDNHSELPFCREDVRAFESLLKATARFDPIIPKIDLDADRMRALVRETLPVDEGFEEVFFFFSGHGYRNQSDLYLCGTNFDIERPNETGFSHGELIDYFRAAGPNVLITVFDTCFAGARLVKDTQVLPEVAKNGLRNVIQFSSSLDDQASLGGEKLSKFSRSFLEACVRKSEGEVYYTDIKKHLA